MSKIEELKNKIKETVEYYKCRQIHSESSFGPNEFEELKNELLKDIDRVYIPQWKSTDPRVDINKRARIVILRPDSYGHGHFEAGEANIETKNSYCIWATFSKQSVFINADDEWDSAWMWTFFPWPEDVIKDYQNG